MAPGPSWSPEEEREFLIRLIQQALDSGWTGPRLSEINMSSSRTAKALSHRWGKVREDCRNIRAGGIQTGLSIESASPSPRAKKRVAKQSPSARLSKRGKVEVKKEDGDENEGASWVESPYPREKKESRDDSDDDKFESFGAGVGV